ncbi:MAG: hypothetical protein ACYDDV_02720 [Methanoregula sp.]
MVKVRPYGFPALDRGEAIPSTFSILFPVSTRIRRFGDYISELNREKKQKITKGPESGSGPDIVFVRVPATAFPRANIPGDQRQASSFIFYPEDQILCRSKKTIKPYPFH